MKVISPALLTALKQDLTTLCRLWAIEDPNGSVLRYTDHHSDIKFEGNVYSATNAFSASATMLAANSIGSDVQIDILLGAAGLEYQRIERGLFDNANVDLVAVSYKHLDAGSIDLLVGSIRTVQFTNPLFATLSIGPRLGKIDKPINEIYSAYCRAGFGDERCKVNLGAHTTAFEVESVASSQSFTIDAAGSSPNDYYAQGTVSWLTGRNAGTNIEVIRNTAGQVFTLLPCKMPVQQGDTGNIVRGCPKTLAACQGYGNVPNYRGEPYVPGTEGLK